MDGKQKSRKAGRRILIGFLGAFGVVAAVNALFIYKAVTTHTGEVTDNAYHRGLAYNKTLAAAKEQEKLGWTTDVALQKKPDGLYDVSLKVMDKTGKTVVFDSVQGRLRRPVNAADDVAASFSASGDGVYHARVALPLPGQWEVHATLMSGDRPFHVVKRIVIQ